MSSLCLIDGYSDHVEDIVSAATAGKVVGRFGQTLKHGTDGLRATIDWYRENESWWRPLKDAVEARYEQRGQ